MFNTRRAVPSRLVARSLEARQDEPLFEELEPRQMMAADVAVTTLAFTTAGPFAPGATVVATATIRNIGANASAAGTISLVLSTNNVYGDADDIELLPPDANSIDPLNAGQQLLPTTSDPITLPVGAVPGYYYLIGRLTVPGDANAANDTLVSPTRYAIQIAAPGPDLNLTTTVTGGTFRPGQTVNGTATVRNTGAATTGAGFALSYALSVDAIWGNSDDIVITSPTGMTGSTLAAGATAAAAPLAFTIGADVPNGTYRLLAHVDSDREISETNESNNVYAQALANIIIARPDLTGTIAGPVTIAAGSVFTPTVTIRNAGGFASGPANYSIALRPAGAPDNSTDITILFSGNIPALAAGASMLPITGQVAVPTTVPAGVYRLVLNVDTLDDITEGNELNNTIVAATNTTVTNPGTATLPDLVVAVTPVTATLIPGGLLDPYFVRVSNLGQTINNAFSVQIFLSTNNTLDGSDISIGSFNSGAVPATAEFQQVGLLPTWMPGGNYYVIARVDADGDVSESNENNNNGATALASITVIRPTISIAATDPAAAEVNAPALANPGVFTVTRTGPTTQPLVVNYTLGGTATPGADYTALPGSVTIPAGALSATFSVNVFNEDVGEPTETVIATLGRGVGYSINLALNRATVNITDNEAVVTIVASDPIAGEVTAPLAQDPGRFTFTRTGSLTNPLDVTYIISGTSSGADYAPLTGIVTIPAGQATAQLNISVIDDAVGESSETLTLTIIDGVGYGPGLAASATVTINDNEPIVTVSAIDAFAAQTRQGETINTGQFRFTRTGSTANPFTISYTIGGTAVNGVDYLDLGTGLALTGQVIIPAGQTGVAVTIAPQVVARAAAMTVTLSVDTTPGGPYRIANPNVAATVNIQTLPPVNLTATALTFLPASISLSAPSTTTNFSFTIDRSGLAGTLAAFTAQIRLSANNVLGDADDIVLFTRSFAAGFTGSVSENGTLNWDTLPLVLPGAYNLGLFVDSGSLVSEFDEIDNRLISPSGQVTFTP